MKLFAKAVYERIDPIIYQEECTQEGFNKLYEKGLDLKSSNNDVDYEIGVFTDEYKLFWSINPFPLKVAKNYLLENFEEYAKEELKAFLSDDFQNDKLEMEYASKKQKEWESAPDFLNRTMPSIDIWGRLGISLTVTPDEMDVLKGENDKAKDLLINLVQSDRCTMYGDTYFPELIYNNYLDLDFDLPETPLHKENQREHAAIVENNSIESRINKAKVRSDEKIVTSVQNEIIR